MLESMLWTQLQQANAQISLLQTQLGMVIDRQFYRPVTNPRTDLANNDAPEFSPLSEEAIEDQAQVNASIEAQTKADQVYAEMLREAEKEFGDLVEEHEAAHASV